MLEKALSANKAKDYVGKLLNVFNISNINRVVLEDALESNFSDYEDGVLYQSAVHVNLEAFVTRNQKDFSQSDIPVYSPSELIDALNILE